MPTNPLREPTPDPRRFEVDRALLHRGGEARGWGNLGDWSRARSYAEACEALAVRVGEAAHLRQGDRVFEAACGEGEGMRLWLGRFGVQHAVGVELHPGSVTRARSRLAASATPERWRVDLGSATDPSAIEDGTLDAVVCVDAAYHFDPRDRFFREARRVLRPGGRLAVTDIVLARDPGGTLAEAALRGVARGCAIPRQNLCTVETYAARMESAGFGDVTVQRLDGEVLGGFASFVRAHRRAHLRASLGGGWAKVLVTGWGAGVAHERTWVHYVLVSARAGAPSAAQTP